MIDIGDSKEVLKQAAIEKRKPRPKPVIEVGNSSSKFQVSGVEEKPNIEIKLDTEGLKPLNSAIKDTLLLQLENEYAVVFKERNILSTEIYRMVENGATQGELASHYKKIESYRPALIDYYNKIKYVKQHGHLPEASDVVSPMSEAPKSLLELKDIRSKLIDKRCKLKAKLKPSATPSKADQVVFWELELAQAEAEYQNVQERIKAIS